MPNVHLTLKSRNAKTGPIPVSTTSADTCPASCPFNHANTGGCYASYGPLRLFWDKVTNGSTGSDWGTFCNDIHSLPEGTLWRHNQAGDLPGFGDTIDTQALSMLVDANSGKRGFTYTHKPMHIAANREAVASANAQGFRVNLSANTLEHADELAGLGIAPVVTVLPKDARENTATPEGRKVVVCPATIRDDVSCATCQLCQRSRDFIVGFPAHGAGARKVELARANT